MRSLPGHSLVSALAFGFGLGCAEGMGVQGTATALQPPAPEPLASPAQKRENAHLKSTRCLQMFKVLQLGFDSCVVLAQGIFLQRNMILKNSNNPILISLITFIKAIV